ncbi:MAG: hypothetical protein QF752_03225 [Planctomycetota bacterium]|jgi:pimeloyl-ACP methyl ester carboxylesterase|nr:hypothetical protein [Planctomycetota bacterium]
MKNFWIKVTVFLLLGTHGLYAGSERVKIASFDGAELEAELSVPDGVTPVELRSLVVLIHGSGPQGMDADLTRVTRNEERNLLFVACRDALLESGFGVLRYHKRSYQIRKILKEDPSYKDSEAFRAFDENPLRYIVDDARAVAEWAHKRAPKAAVSLLGFSQGTYVGLQVADQLDWIRGVGLVGFYTGMLDNTLFEQLIYRPARVFRDLDADRNERLSKEELGAKGHDRYRMALLAQFPMLDQNRDESIGLDEFKAGNLTNILLRDLLGTYRKQEVLYPRVEEILKRLKVPVCFFNGAWDNQTPVYHTLAVRFLNQAVWKKETLHFRIFPELGHILDRRDSYDDLLYRPIDAEALGELVRDLRRYVGSESGD